MPEKKSNERKKFFGIQDWKSPYVVGWGLMALIACLMLADRLIGLGSKLENWEFVSAIIRNGFIVVGGVVGFVLAIIRIRQTDDQLSVAKTEADGRENERVRESFQQAVAMLYGEEDEIKPFAITQIRRIAVNHPDLHLEQAVSLLCGFVRKSAPVQSGVASDLKTVAVKQVPLELIKQCIDVVCDLSAQFEYQGKGSVPINLRNTDLRTYNIRGITLNADSIIGSALQHTRFFECKFSGQLTNVTSFSEVIFDNVTFDDVHFFKSSFETTRFFDCIFVGSSWSGCSFEGGAQYGTKIRVGVSSRVRGIFVNCDLSDWRIGLPISDPPLAGYERGFSPEDFRKCYAMSNSLPVGFEHNYPSLVVGYDNDSNSADGMIVVREAVQHD